MTVAERMDELPDQILTEVAAIGAELRVGGQDAGRLQALRNARETHLQRGSQLEGRKAALQKELEEVDRMLSGGEPATD